MLYWICYGIFNSGIPIVCFFIYHIRIKTSFCVNVYYIYIYKKCQPKLKWFIHILGQGLFCKQILREKNTDPNFLLKVCLIHWVRTVYFLFTPKDVYNEIMLQNRKFRFTLSYELLKSRLKLIIISSSSCCKGKAVMSFLQTTVKTSIHHT